LNSARALHASGQLIQAHEKYIALLKLYPLSPDLFNELGNLLADGNHLELAIKAYDTAIKFSPTFAIAYYNQGNCYLKMQQPDKAVVSFQSAVGIEAGFYEAHLNLGNAYRLLGLNDQAIASFEKAILAAPNKAGPHINIGSLHFEARDLAQAQASFQIALKLEPHSAQAHWNLSLLLLLKGNFNEAWPHYEWRWRRGGYCHAGNRSFEQPLWLGQFPIKGKTILVHAEQGIGDTLQFVRFAQYLKVQGAKVILEVQPPLVSLLGSLPYLDKVLTRGDDLQNFDAHIGLMSLPYALKLDLSKLTTKEAYLQAPKHLINYWTLRLPSHKGVRVGLVWSGGFRPQQPEVWQLNERRNISLSELACLKIPGIQWISLQKGQPSESDPELLEKQQWNGPHILNFSKHLQDFADTAALIASLDLVISVDTSTAHLAGAMGKPTWVLNRFDACWRWQLNRTDSPWYPHMKLYRQDQPGQWHSVVQQLRHDLIEFSQSDQLNLNKP
jgi:hypothetical protein